MLVKDRIHSKGIPETANCRRVCPFAVSMDCEEPGRCELLAERLFQIRNQIIHILDADRKTDEIRSDACLDQLLVG